MYYIYVFLFQKKPDNQQQVKINTFDCHIRQFQWFLTRHSRLLQLVKIVNWIRRVLDMFSWTIVAFPETLVLRRTQITN